MNIIKKMIPIGLVFAFASIFLPATAQSEETPARGPASFSEYDKDGNGSISEDEFNATHKQRMAGKAAAGMPMRGAANPPAFSDFDTNDDGQLNQDELAAGRKARMENRQGMGQDCMGKKGMGQGCMGDDKGCCAGKNGGKRCAAGGGDGQGCCAGKGMKQGGGGMGKGMMQGSGGMGKGKMKGCTMNMSRTRHHFVMRNGIESKYVDQTNPLQGTAGNIKDGKNLYEKNCASCHGVSGQGDGKAGKGLNPGPTNIAMFSKMPMASDGYLLWTVSEGGAPVQSAMPAFKTKLKEDDIWRIISYLRQL